MIKSVVGILAHVDAGKTTLAESLLFKTGRLRKIGRVDKGDTHLDTHDLERARGITIFAGQSVISLGNTEITLLDTPGHVDFSAETERILRVLDYAVMVISGTDGVQAHTATLWKLLDFYNIPTFIFVTKMDFARFDKAYLMAGIKKELSDNCIDMSDDNADKQEEMAFCSDAAMEMYEKSGAVDDKTAASLIAGRKMFPCYFGSGFKADGVDEFIAALDGYILPKAYPESFGAKVFKITHDSNGARITHLKITGGRLKTKDILNYRGKSEKVNEIRIYSGAKYESADEVEAGGVCAVTGISDAKSGEGFGIEKADGEPVLEPVMKYSLVLPDGMDAKTFMPSLKEIEEEEPLLNVSWNSHLQQISVSLMGQVQVEILKSLILQRYDVAVDIVNGRVQYKETINDTVEGVGHYEPLRHYSEVHLILSPLGRGEGIRFSSVCNEDLLDRNWQRLILQNLSEKQHLGVLTGSPVTDIKFTLASGKAHLKHTEGGDFRQSTYRAVRQGLMQAQSVLLEPYYNFRIETPPEHIGRVISDIKMLSGEFDAPFEDGSMTVLCGKAPVSTMNSYAASLASFTSGRGRIQLSVSGYDICHNAAEVIADAAYNPESDLENTPDSVFCAHGSGFPVKWNEVKNYMHLESCLKKKNDAVYAPRNFRIEDKELEAIMEREFGPQKTTQTLYRAPKPITGGVFDWKDVASRDRYLIVDGYNCIFAWESLKEDAESDISLARKKLMDTLCNYAAFTESNVVLVFDGYKVSGNPGEKYKYNNINVVYTKERETADAYIEKFVSDVGKNHNVKVVTSDGLIQLSAVRFGVIRLSSREFESEIEARSREISEFIKTHM